jgi:hypothetical protein
VDLVGSVQSFVLLILGIASLALTGYSAFDASRYQANLFPAVGRLSKAMWLGILIAAFLISIVFLFSALSLLNIVGVIAAAVYLADVRPKLKQVSGGGGSSHGPYGPYR